MLKLPSPNVATETQTVYISYKGAYGPAVLPGNLLCKLTLAGCQRTKLYKNLTYGLHVGCGYRVKLQRWEHTERRMPENNNDDSIWKIPLQLTSVRLAHARPNNVVLVHPSQYTLAPLIQNWFLLHCYLCILMYTCVYLYIPMCT